MTTYRLTPRFAAYCLPTGAIIFRPELDGIKPLDGAVFLAEGDRNTMPRRVRALAECDGATIYVPGARNASKKGWRQACRAFIEDLELSRATPFVDHPPPNGPAASPSSQEVMAQPGQGGE